jgi:hypothetical protein
VVFEEEAIESIPVEERPENENRDELITILASESVHIKWSIYGTISRQKSGKV